MGKACFSQRVSDWWRPPTKNRPRTVGTRLCFTAHLLYATTVDHGIVRSMYESMGYLGGQFLDQVYTRILDGEASEQSDAAPTVPPGLS